MLKRFTNVKGLLCDTCHSSRCFVTSENEENVIIGHCDSCHSVTLFCLQKLGVSKIPKPLCSIVSVSISLHPMVRKKSKNGHFIMEDLVFDTGTKNVENAIFQFST